MEEVILDLSTYNELQNRLRTKTSRIDELEHELAKVNEDHEAEFEEHFKQGLFNEELEKYKQEHLNNLIKQLAEKEETIQDLKYKIERMENRSLIERICNK